MARIDRLTQQRERRNRLALLALSGKTSPPSPCPGEEVLACLVEGKLSPQEAASCREHLAGCEACYQVWLQLDHLHAQRRPGSILPFAVRPRLLAVAGSLLAAAASVVLIINVLPEAQREFPLPGTGPDKSQVVAPAKEEVATEASDNEERAESMMADDVAPAAKRQMPAEAEVMAQEELGAGRQAPATLAAPAPAAEPRLQRKAAGKPEAEPAPQVYDNDNGAAKSKAVASLSGQEGTRPGMTDFALWWQQLETICQEGHPDADRLAVLARQGQRLFAGEAQLAAGERQRLQQALDILGADPSPPPARLCQQLQEVKAP
jgi:hypothetical protein